MVVASLFVVGGFVVVTDLLFVVLYADLLALCLWLCYVGFLLWVCDCVDSGYWWCCFDSFVILCFLFGNDCLCLYCV